MTYHLYFLSLYPQQIYMYLLFVLSDYLLQYHL
nr:MAG TPA: hypothetical protein [Caudoviricetes sp.]